MNQIQEKEVEAHMLAKLLMGLGYFVTSNKHSTVSRITEPHWMDKYPNRSADFIRRVVSKDNLFVPREILKLMQNSQDTVVGYAPCSNPTRDMAIRRMNEFAKKYLKGKTTFGETR